MQDDEDPGQIVALIPGGGWMIYHSQEERGPGPIARFIRGRQPAETAPGWSDPVVAWALLANGAVVPLGTGPDGTVWAMSAEQGEIWHPDSSGIRYQDHLRLYREQMHPGGS
jgi:hypothetical protein